MAAAKALVLHGLTSTPESVRSLALGLEAAGFEVSSPLLPGHGTTADDLESTGWPAWAEAVEAELARLSTGNERVVVAGLSMGGSLACHLAATHASDVAGLIAINPFIDPPAPSFREALRGMVEAGFPRAPSIGGDAADPEAEEVGYDELPIASLLSLCEGLDGLLPRLPLITCPTLLFTSRVDHVVPTVSSDMLAERVAGPLERVWLERSWHLATLDYEGEEVARRAIDFAIKVTHS